MPESGLPQLDPWQYRLLPAGLTAGEPAAATLALGGFRLEVGEGLPLCEVGDARGRPLGVLLGHPVDLQRRTLLQGRWQAPVEGPGDGPDATALAIHAALGGPSLLILTTDGGPRIYPDVAAQIPCVFDTASGAAGSTAFALLGAEDYEARLDRALYARLGVDGAGWFPAALTAHRGIRRLLPGHVLELESGRIRRFWPRAPIPPCRDPAAVVAGVIALVQAQIEALLAGDRPIAMGLTAGQDTRALWACARPWRDRIACVTVTGADRHQVDSVVARRIAARFGLRHIELPRIEASAEQRQRFIRRGGHCYADSNAQFHPAVWPAAQFGALLGGLGGEYAQGFLWHDRDSPDLQLTPARLCDRLGLPAAPELLAALQDWLSELPPLDAFAQLDLAYNELRMAGWSSVQFPCDPMLLRFSPLLNWRVVELMFSLPPDWKRSRRLGQEIIAREWPELAGIPFNTLGPWRDLWIRLQRVGKDPRAIARRLRKLRGRL